MNFWNVLIDECGYDFVLAVLLIYIIELDCTSFHQCRYGYENNLVVELFMDIYASTKTPLETIWTNIDYMDDFKDFTLDLMNFLKMEMKKFVEQIHANKKKYFRIFCSRERENIIYLLRWRDRDNISLMRRSYVLLLLYYFYWVVIIVGKKGSTGHQPELVYCCT